MTMSIGGFPLNMDTAVKVRQMLMCFLRTIIASLDVFMVYDLCHKGMRCLCHYFGFQLLLSHILSDIMHANTFLYHMWKISIYISLKLMK